MDYIFHSLFMGKQLFLLVFFWVQHNKKGSSSALRDQDCFRQENSSFSSETSDTGQGQLLFLRIGAEKCQAVTAHACCLLQRRNMTLYLLYMQFNPCSHQCIHRTTAPELGVGDFLRWGHKIFLLMWSQLNSNGRGFQPKWNHPLNRSFIQKSCANSRYHAQ